MSRAAGWPTSPLQGVIPLPVDPPASSGLPACLAAHPEPLSTNSRYLHARPRVVAAARTFVTETLGDLAKADVDHAEDLMLIVSELVTNAIKHVAGIRDVWLDIEVWPRWTLVAVDDRDPTVHPPNAFAAADPLPESLRGLGIVAALSERFWWQRRAMSKTANAVVLRSDTKLTRDDRVLLDALQTSERERTRDGR